MSLNKTGAFLFFDSAAKTGTPVFTENLRNRWPFHNGLMRVADAVMQRGVFPLISDHTRVIGAGGGLHVVGIDDFLWSDDPSDGEFPTSLSSNTRTQYARGNVRFGSLEYWRLIFVNGVNLILRSDAKVLLLGGWEGAIYPAVTGEGGFRDTGLVAPSSISSLMGIETEVHQAYTGVWCITKDMLLLDLLSENPTSDYHHTTTPTETLDFPPTSRAELSRLIAIDKIFDRFDANWAKLLWGWTYEMVKKRTTKYYRVDEDGTVTTDRADYSDEYYYGSNDVSLSRSVSFWQQGVGEISVGSADGIWSAEYWQVMNRDSSLGVLPSRLPEGGETIEIALPSFGAAFEAVGFFVFDGTVPTGYLPNGKRDPSFTFNVTLEVTSSVDSPVSDDLKESSVEIYTDGWPASCLRNNGYVKKMKFASGITVKDDFHRYVLDATNRKYKETREVNNPKLKHFSIVEGNDLDALAKQAVRVPYSDCKVVTGGGLTQLPTMLPKGTALVVNGPDSSIAKETFIGVYSLHDSPSKGGLLYPFAILKPNGERVFTYDRYTTGENVIHIPWEIETGIYSQRANHPECKESVTAKMKNNFALRAQWNWAPHET